MRKENLCLQTENGECATCNSNDNVKTSRSRDEMMWKLFCLALSLLNTVQLCQAAPDILSEEPVAADTSGTSWQGDVGNDAADAAPNTSEVLAGPGQGPIEQRAGAPLPPSPQPGPRPCPQRPPFPSPAAAVVDGPVGAIGPDAELSGFGGFGPFNNKVAGPRVFDGGIGSGPFIHKPIANGERIVDGGHGPLGPGPLHGVHGPVGLPLFDITPLLDGHHVDPRVPIPGPFNAFQCRRS